MLFLVYPLKEIEMWSFKDYLCMRYTLKYFLSKSQFVLPVIKDSIGKIHHLIGINNQNETKTEQASLVSPSINTLIYIMI